MQKNKLKYYLGLDLGIESVGWAVMAEDAEKNHTLHDFGVRLFKLAEDRQSNTLAQKRRGFRSVRRSNRRKKYRIQQLKKLLTKNNFLNFEEYNKQIGKKNVTNKIVLDSNKQWTTEDGFWNPHVLKVQALEKQVSKAELWAILINYCKKRGYADKFSLEGEENGKKTKLTQFSSRGEKLIAKYGSVAKAILNDQYFHLISKPEYRILWSNNSPKIFYKTDENGAKKIYDWASLSTDEKKTMKNNEPQGFRVLFSRDDYKKELKQILKQQSNYYDELKSAELRDKIKQTIFQSRDFEIGAKCEECWKHFFKTNEWIKHKSADGKLAGNCTNYGTFHEKIEKCQYFADELRGSKDSLIFTIYYYVCELSKVFSMLKNHKIELTKEQYVEVLRMVLLKDKGEVTKKKEIINFLANIPQIKEHEDDNLISYGSGMWRAGKDSGLSLEAPKFWKKLCLKIPQINKIIQKTNFDIHFFVNKLHENHLVKRLGDIISNWRTPSKRKAKLQKLFQEFNLEIETKTMDVFLGFSKSGIANVSIKYMLEAIKAFYQGKPYGDFQEEMRVQKEKNMKKMHAKRENAPLFSKFFNSEMQNNPIVFRAINQTRKVLKALYKKYKSFEGVAIELSRDLSKSAKDRDEETKRNKKNAQRTKLIIDELEKLNIKVSKTAILSYRLWKQQNEKCIYTQKPIKSWQIDPGKKYVEIDHIIPRSKYADDSPENLVLTFAEENQRKKNRIPKQYLTPDQWKNFKTWVNFLADGYVKCQNCQKTNRKKSKNCKNCKQEIGNNFIIGEKKQKYLLANSADEIVDNYFATRNLNDTRYICKYFYNYVKEELKTAKNVKDNVFTVKGAVTSNLRRAWLKNSPWGLYKKVREITPFHHAVDAIILCQFKRQWEVELANDLVRLRKLKNSVWWSAKKDGENSWKHEQAKNIKNRFVQQICNNWNREGHRNLEYIKLIRKADETDNFGESWHIKNLANELKCRIPVELKIEKCPKCNLETESQESKLTCIECYKDKKIPKYVRDLNEAEWRKKIKDENFVRNNVDLHYPHISRMYSYKVSGSIAFKENIGFYAPNSDKRKLKNLLFWKWKENSSISYVEFSKNKKTRNISEEEFEKWIKEFEEEKSYLFLAKKNRILELSYYGVLMPKTRDEKAEWIRKYYAKKNENNLIKKRKYLLIPGKLIEYQDKKTGRKVLKTFSGKAGWASYLISNNLTNSYNRQRNEKVFGDRNVYYDSIPNILKSEWKIREVNLLGKILN